jgi:pyruvate dehydrogenase (quinone)
MVTIGTLVSMTNGPCCAIAAEVAYPDGQSVALVRDGGFSMLMGKVATAVRYELPIKVIVIKNKSLGKRPAGYCLRNYHKRLCA